MIKIDDEIMWEDTGQIIVHNYPANYKTFSYITRLYREHKKGVYTLREVQGPAIYFYDMTYEQATLAVILGHAQNALAASLSHNIKE